MFWALKGTTRTPRLEKHLQIAAVIRLLPTDELVPMIINVLAVMILFRCQALLGGDNFLTIAACQCDELFDRNRL